MEEMKMGRIGGLFSRRESVLNGEDGKVDV